MVGISDLRGDPVNFRDREGGGDLTVSGDGALHDCVRYSYLCLLFLGFLPLILHLIRCPEEAPGGGGHRAAALRLELGGFPQQALTSCSVLSRLNQ